MKKTPKCKNCESEVILKEIQTERCTNCNESLDPWETGFAGDLHELVGG